METILHTERRCIPLTSENRSLRGASARAVHVGRGGHRTEDGAEDVGIRLGLVSLVDAWAEGGAARVDGRSAVGRDRRRCARRHNRDVLQERSGGSEDGGDDV